MLRMLLFLAAALLEMCPLGLADDHYKAERMEMVAKQIRSRGIRDARVLAAMEKVPRHLLLDRSLWSRAYDDHPLPIGEG